MTNNTIIDDKYAEMIADYVYGESIVISPEEIKVLEKYVVLLISIITGYSREAAEFVLDNILDLHCV